VPLLLPAALLLPQLPLALHATHQPQFSRVLLHPENL
jgi:hypothetical protein